MKKLLAITLSSFLMMGHAIAAINNGIGGSSGGSNSMDWGDILRSSAEYRTHFPSIYYNGTTISIDNLCDNGTEIVTATEIPIRVKPSDGPVDAPKILEYQRVRIPRWRLVTAACRQSLDVDSTSDRCIEMRADSAAPLRYKVRVEPLHHSIGLEAVPFEKEYVIPTCEEWDYLRNQVNASDFWESFLRT